MTTDSTSAAAWRIRDLKRNAARAPGGAEFGALVAAHAPVVQGVVAQLLPEGMPLEGTVTAVFQAFAAKWRRLARRTMIGPWLLRTARYAALRERKRVGLRRPRLPGGDGEADGLLKNYFRLRGHHQEAVYLRHLAEPTSEAALPAVVKHASKGIAKLTKSCRKFAPSPAARLEGWRVAPDPAQVDPSRLTAMAIGAARQRPPLVRGVLRDWFWWRVRLGFKRLARGVAIGVLTIVSFIGTMHLLAMHGFFPEFFQRLGNQELAKQAPGALVPAGPWPPAEMEGLLASRSVPKRSSELYVWTNIWTAKLSMTAEAWKQIQATRVPNRGQPSGDEGKGLTLRNPNARRNGLLGAAGWEFDWAEASLEFAGESFPKVAARYRGNGTYFQSLYGPKRSFKVDLNKYVKGQDIAGVNTLNFLNMIVDSSNLHDALAERLFRDLGVPAPRTAYAYFTLNVEGKFENKPLGLYALVENVDGDYAKDRFGSKKVPIFKPVTYNLFKDLGADWKEYASIYDLKTEATPAQLERVIEMARLVTHAKDGEFAHRLPEFLDLEEFAAFLAGHVLISAYDGFLSTGQNFYMYLDPRSSKFGFISWDHDHSWGEFRYVRSAEAREQASIWQPATYDFRFLDRVLKVEAFRTVYRKTLERAMAELFTVERLYAQMDEVATVIRPAVAAESEFRLKRFEQAIATEWLPGNRDSGPSEGPLSRVHQTKRFIAARVKSVQAQLAGKSEGVRLHGRH